MVVQDRRSGLTTTIDEEEWIIKFPAHSGVDGKNAGKMEYDYSV